METAQFVGGTTFHVATGEVRRGDTVRRLEPQPAQVLSLLIRRAGGLVTHDEIKREVWGDETHVDFRDGVHYCIRQIRAALGDHARAPRVVTTVPKRGYRLIAEALVRPDSAHAIASESRPPEGLSATAAIAGVGEWRRRLVITGLTVGLGVALVIFERRPNNHHATATAVLKAVHGFIY